MDCNGFMNTNRRRVQVTERKKKENEKPPTKIYKKNLKTN